MTDSSAGDPNRNPRRLTAYLSAIAVLFCWIVAFVVGGTSGIALALLGLLALVMAVVNFRGHGGP